MTFGKEAADLLAVGATFPALALNSIHTFDPAAIKKLHGCDICYIRLI